MTPEERDSLLDQIETSGMDGLHAIIADLERRAVTPEIIDLHEHAVDKLYSLAGAGGDW